MSEGKRPGGLTALAVLNFVFAAVGMLNALGQAVLAFMLLSGNLPESMDEKAREGFDKMRELGIGNFMLALAATGIVVAALQLTSGVGYLKQKRVLGRFVGNTYALVSIGHTVLMTYGFTAEGEQQGFQLVTLIFIIYPVLTLTLLNTTFKEDLVN